jgi:hypothetical protein
MATSQPALEQILGLPSSHVTDWDHLQTYHIEHALPHQETPTPDPYELPPPVHKKLRACCKYQSLPEIQRVLLSGRKTAEALVHEIYRKTTIKKDKYILNINTMFMRNAG